jgi:hypothetical protein
MFRIDNSTTVPALPVVPPVGTPGYFTNGNPATGLAPTHVDDWFMNTVQEEILSVVVNAGLTPNKNDHTQLWKALEGRYATIGSLATGGPYLPLTGGTIYSPGVSSPLTIRADNGLYAQIGYVGTRSWAAGVYNDGSFAIADETAGGLNRLIINSLGAVYLSGIVVGTNGIEYTGVGGTHNHSFTWDGYDVVAWVDGNNVGTLVTGASYLRLLATQTTPGTYSFTVPAAVTRIWIECLGGGGGGAMEGAVNTGGGGGAGGYTEGWFNVTPGQVLSVTVGGQGVGGSPGDGSAGGSSSVGSLCSSSGGLGGHSVADAAGGMGGVGYGGPLGNYSGWGGDGANKAIGNTHAGHGGASYFGGGSRAVASPLGSAFASNGAGGGGTYNNAGINGCYGMPGYVLIYG